MNWNILNTEAEYQKAITRTLAVFHAPEESKEARELALLLLLVKDYEDKHIVLPEINIIKEYFQLPAELFLKAS